MTQMTVTDLQTTLYPSVYCRLPLFVFTSQDNITSDLWKCRQLCQSLDESQTKEKGKRWKAKLHWRSLFRTSNRERFSQQSAGLQGDGVVISWQRGAGHVGTTRSTSKTPDVENADCTHTLSVSVCDISLHLCLFLEQSLADIYGRVKLQDIALDVHSHLDRNEKFWKVNWVLGKWKWFKRKSFQFWFLLSSQDIFRWCLTSLFI